MRVVLSCIWHTSWDLVKNITAHVLVSPVKYKRNDESLSGMMQFWLDLTLCSPCDGLYFSFSFQDQEQALALGTELVAPLEGFKQSSATKTNQSRRK
jgi:hypothetical protein